MKGELLATVGEVVRQIRRKTNCFFLREGANHEIWFNPNTGRKFQIPRHYSEELKPKTLHNILKSAGLK